MRTFLKGVALVALLCPSLTSAASCTGGTCLEYHDEVSFVQVKQEVKKKQHANANAERAETESFPHGAVHAFPHGTVHEEAVIHSMPNGVNKGSVVKAFEKNLAKVKKAMSDSIKKDVAFENKVHKARVKSDEKLEAAVRKDQRKVEKSIKKEDAAVRKVAKHREKVEEKAQKAIDKAKADALAHDEKRWQVEQADVAGRWEGALEGYDKAEREIHNQHDDWENEREDKIVKEEKEQAKRHKHRVQAAIDETTKWMEERNKALAHRAAEHADREIEHVKADAHIEEEGIEGPDGLNNRLDTDNADRWARHYKRDIKSDEKRIKEADGTKWPKGDFPVVEPGMPGILEGLHGGSGGDFPVVEPGMPGILEGLHR